MTTVLMVPVKDLAQAKSRLSPLLSLEERRELAGILLRGVLERVAALRRPLRRVVVSNYAPALEMARGMGFEVLVEPRQISESVSVDQASRLFEAQGVKAILRVPLDLPLLDETEVETLLARAEAGLQAILVPSLEGTGTNALYRSPPLLFPSRFGPGSLALHESALRALGVPHGVLPLPSLALDLDDGGDVEELLRRDPRCPAARFLIELGVLARLAAMAREGA